MALLEKKISCFTLLRLIFILISIFIREGCIYAQVSKLGLLHENGKPHCKLFQDQNSLHCSLRTLQSAIDATDNDIRRVQHLQVKCSDMFFFESKLKSEHFGKLPALEELDIEFCKIRHLPPRAFAGLSHLKRLSVQSHNSEWTSILMDIDVNSFQKLEKIQVLNLANNNLWSLPINTLCNLPYLKKLNMSRNHLLGAVDLGLSFIDGCKIPLLELDVSNNHMSSLGYGDLHQVKDLVKLDLSANRLKILDENALDTLLYLEELNLADNQLSALPPTLFNKSQNLQKLMLQNNSLTMLTSQLFSGLTNLTVLNLSRNAISTHLLAPDTFTSDLQHLKVLDLSYNQMSKLETSTFASLSSLQVLNLKHNNFHIIANGVFSFQSRLQILSLSRNNIESIEKDAFVGLVSLTSLSLDHNRIRNLYDNQLDESASTLEDISFNSNLLVQVPRTISILRKLRTLDLGENEISGLRSDDFSSLNNLYGLRIAGNRIEKITKEHFVNTSTLHVLNLAHNQLSEIEQGAFKQLQNLRALRLDNNRLRDINGLVSSLSNLQWFNASSNRLQWFDYAFIPMSLEWLDIHDNEIEELGNYYHLKSGFALKTLDASSNLIRSLSKLSLPTSLERIILNRNAIRQIAENTFEDKPYLSRVEVASNEINHMKLATLSIGKISAKLGRPEFFLAGNPFVCDCELDWLPTINDDPKLTHDSPVVMDLDEITCRFQNRRSDANDVPVPVKSVAPEQFVCAYQTHCFSLCMCCDFYACDCRMQCPDGCSCYHDLSWSTNIIRCGGGERYRFNKINMNVGVNNTATPESSKSRFLEEVPLLIPMDATSVHLDGNNLGSVDTQSFIGRRRITSLYMNSSRITEISRESFGGLSNSLKRLHLEDNRLSELYGHEFEALSGSPLKELYLQNNDIVRISRNTFEPLRSLSILRLDGNLLTTSPMWNMLSGNSHPFLVAVYFAENMWSCDCVFVQRFNRFVRTLGRDKVIDRSKLKCVTDNFVNELMDNVLNDDGLCAKQFVSSDTTNVSISEDNKKILKKDILPILISALLAVAVLVIGFLAVCVYKKKIKNWLYNKSTEIYESSRSSSSTMSASCVVGSGAVIMDNQHHSPATIHSNKLFDIYISYSSKDADFVDNTLAPTLEQGTGTATSGGTDDSQSSKYRLCLHHRNFPPHASVYDTVSVASESSSRILLVLSNTYLETEWPDVKDPLKHSLGGLAGAVNGRLILLLLEDITSAEADSDLQFYLQTCPTIKWGSSGYLNKLHFFLPEPAFMTFQRSVTLRTLHHTDLPVSGTTPPSSTRSSSKYFVKNTKKCVLPFKSQLSSSNSTKGVTGIDPSLWAYTIDSLPLDSVNISNSQFTAPVNSNMDEQSFKRLLLLQQLQKQHKSLQRNVSLNTQARVYRNEAIMNGSNTALTSMYGHHTYQSIPESHIYHTLEPSSLEQNINDITGNMYVINSPKPRSSVYINKNLDLILKPSSSFRNRGGTNISHGSDTNQTAFEQGPGGTDDSSEVDMNGGTSNNKSKIVISSPSSSSTSTTNDLTSNSSSASQHLTGHQTPSAQHNSSCHHIHTNSTLSGQQLIPASGSGDSSNDEYIV